MYVYHMHQHPPQCRNSLSRKTQVAITNSLVNWRLGSGTLCPRITQMRHLAIHLVLRWISIACGMGVWVKNLNLSEWRSPLLLSHLPQQLPHTYSLPDSPIAHTSFTFREYRILTLRCNNKPPVCTWIACWPHHNNWEAGQVVTIVHLRGLG